MTKNNYHILIAENDFEVSNLATMILKDMNYENVRIATTGKDAVIDVMEEKPDLVLLGLKLPKVDGADVLRRIKNIDKNIPVIIITGYPDSDIARTVLKQGVFAFVTKPFKINEFKQNIIKALN
ncbi:response regulator [candidate division WOR-3 bacterium]|nr:response regulator [candidate division WOR-3 bacterium]